MYSVGKRVLHDTYLHVEFVGEALGEEIRISIDRLLACCPAPAAVNVVKVNSRSGRTSLLSYPGFQEEAFPLLADSWTEAEDGSLAHRSYRESLNPPILHRKELLVPADWPGRERWVGNTEIAEAIGLFDDRSTIGMLMNWERLLSEKGYTVRDGQLLPIGNDEETQSLVEHVIGAPGVVSRHRTALQRTSLSAPVQLLLRHALLDGQALFDYGCGHGRDVAELQRFGFAATGWDPHYAPSSPVTEADVVNLGFVINVIEDPAERADALTKAARLARKLLVVSVMLNSNEPHGAVYADGYLTSWNTFQKYFDPEELVDYIEQVIHQRAIIGGPGIALVFFDETLEQSYLASRYRRGGLAQRLVALSRIHRPAVQVRRPRRGTPEAYEPIHVKLAKAQAPLLDELWRLALDAGRFPEDEEVAFITEIKDAFGRLSRARAVISRTRDQSLLADAARARRDDVLLLLVTEQFRRRAPFRKLEPRLQRDVRAFFVTYQAALAEAADLLLRLARVDDILAACRQASEAGLGLLQAEHSLQLHVSLIERLPILLRAYVTCGLLLWGDWHDMDLVKIHVASGKLTLMRYDDFASSPLPSLAQRVKINLRKLSYDVFEYGSVEFPKPLLCRKSRYLNEDSHGYAEQLAFDEQLESLGILSAGDFSPDEMSLRVQLSNRRLAYDGIKLVPCDTIPRLDEPCGAHFTYRDFVECGSTQHRTKIGNLPLQPATYNALYALATEVLEPVIDYFGMIRLTYGFCSSALANEINGGIAPALDQHAACEVSRSGKAVCERGGAACDFMVEDEDMRSVAEWIIANVPFDRLYFYGRDRPLHVSFGPDQARAAYTLVRDERSGRLMPRPFASVAGT